MKRCSTSIFVREMQMKTTCTPTFTAALVTTARTWKQARCPQADEWIRKLWYIYTMGCCSGIKRNACESVLMRASLVAQRLKSLSAVQETWVRSLSQEDPLEKEMATHSSIRAWRIPWSEEPGRLQSVGSQRVGRD